MGGAPFDQSLSGQVDDAQVPHLRQGGHRGLSRLARRHRAPIVGAEHGEPPLGRQRVEQPPRDQHARIRPQVGPSDAGLPVEGQQSVDPRRTLVGVDEGHPEPAFQCAGKPRGDG